MFSLQKLLGKEDKFFTLLEASAEEARTCVQALVKLSKTLDKPPAVDEFAYSRKKDKQITERDQRTRSIPPSSPRWSARTSRTCPTPFTRSPR